MRDGHAVRDPQCLGGWLYRVATHAALRAQTTRWRALPLPDSTETGGTVGAAETDIAHLVHRAEQRDVVSRAVRTLSRREQALLELLGDEADLSYREISARSGIPMGSLGPTRDRAIRKLRAMPEVRRLADVAA